jgi:hypothetical protein
MNISISLIYLFYFHRHRITANDSLKHPWLNFNEHTIITNSLNEEDDEDNNQLK